MSITYKVILKKKNKKAKEGYLQLRTIKNRKPSYKSLGYTVKVSHWNDDKELVYAKDPRADDINEKIREVLSKAKQGKVKTLLSREKSLLKYAEKKIQTIHNINTKRGKKRAINKIKQYLNFLGKDDLLIQELDPHFVQNYYSYLLDNLKTSTANEYMTIFKYFVDNAVKHKLHEFEVDPFTDFDRKDDDTLIDVMTKEEVDTFSNHKFSHPYKHQVQHGFLFMMYSNGMRISDFLNLTWRNFYKKNDKYMIKYQVKKTKRFLDPYLTLTSLRLIIPFMNTYEEVDLNLYNEYLKRQESTKNYLQEFEKEYNSISIRGFNQVFSEYNSLDSFEKTWLLVKEESKKELKQIDLLAKIKTAKEMIAKFDDNMMNTLGEQILKLKVHRPKERVFTRLNKWKGTELDKQSENMATKFNYYLGEMQKELGIKTKIYNHQARHIFAQRLFESGENHHYISLALGHASMMVTESYRQQLVTEEAREVTTAFLNTFN